MTTSEASTHMSESQAIEHIREVVVAEGFAISFEDDCAHDIPPTQLVSTDTIVENRHFDRRWDTPHQIGRQAAIVNFSDIAASGGSPSWSTWALTLPPSISPSELVALTKGYVSVCVEYGVPLIGGNITCADGPMVITVTVGGHVGGRAAIVRTGACVGDIVYVSGYLGDAALGVHYPSEETRLNRHLWRPHIREAEHLRDVQGVTSMMDISDGLLLDASRLAQSSDIQIDLDASEIPLSDVYRQYRGRDSSLALTGGEDYVLLFTANDTFEPPSWAKPIGSCSVGQGIRVDGKVTTPRGFDHFSAECPSD